MEASGEPENPANTAIPQQQPASQPSEGAYYSRQSGGALFKLKCMWLFLLGTALALVGVYCLINRPDVGQNSFVIMLMGLMFTAVGSIYGKRKLAGQAATANYVVDPQQMLMVRPEPAPAVQSAAQPGSVQQGAAEAAKPVVQTQASGSQTGQVQVTEAKAAEIRKIFVCPKCGAENEMEDKFCYKCGFRFTKPKKKAEKAPSKKAKPSRSKARAKESAEPIEKTGKPSKPAAAIAKKKSRKEGF